MDLQVDLALLNPVASNWRDVLSFCHQPELLNVKLCTKNKNANFHFVFGQLETNKFSYWVNITSINTKSPPVRLSDLESCGCDVFRVCELRMRFWWRSSLTARQRFVAQQQSAGLKVFDHGIYNWNNQTCVFTKQFALDDFNINDTIRFTCFKIKGKSNSNCRRAF